MKLKTILVVGIFTVVLAGCVPWDEENVVKNGIHFEKFRQEKLHYGEEGKTVFSGVLAEDTEIQGYSCRKESVTFYADWQLKEFILAKPTVVNNILFPADTWIFPAEGGYINAAVFPKNIEIQGHLVRGGRGGPEGVVTSFHKNGALKSFFSIEDVEINSVPCKGSVLHSIELFDSGELQSCTLAYPATIEGHAYAKNARVTLERNKEQGEAE